MPITLSKSVLSTLCTTAVLALSALPAQAGKTVDEIKKRGQLEIGRASCRERV